MKLEKALQAIYETHYSDEGFKTGATSKIERVLNNGKNFEEHLISVFKQFFPVINVDQVLFNDKKTLKKEIASLDNEKILKNNFIEDNGIGFPFIIDQPFGSQDFPDFLYVSNEEIIPIEAKHATNTEPV